jgi:hypothetical protein
MKVYFSNTIWKRQLRTLSDAAVGVGGLALVFWVLAIVNAIPSQKSIGRERFFESCALVAAAMLMIQVVVSGLLLGAEEEENRTDSFVLRLPVSKMRWVAERIVAAAMGLVLCFLLLLCDAIVLGLSLKMPGMKEGLTKSIADIVTFRNIVLGFTYFWIAACCAAWIKKALPAAIVSAGTIFLLLLVLGKIVMHTQYSILNPMQGVAIGFFVIAFVFMGFFFLAISRREGT